MIKTLDALRRRVAALEGGGGEHRAPLLPLGLPGLEGLETGALHEIAPASFAPLEDGAALGFAAFLLGRLAALRDRPVLWLAEEAVPHAPGLMRFGLDPSRLVVGLPGRPKAMLWALEEATRSPAPAAVLGEVRGMDFTAARRLQLAARASGTTLLLFNRAAEAVAPAVTRWRAAGLPGGEERRRLELVRCRGRSPDERGIVARWDVEWEEEENHGPTHRLRVAAPAGDGSGLPDAARVA